jgi:hypothetical protein
VVHPPQELAGIERFGRVAHPKLGCPVQAPLGRADDAASLPRPVCLRATGWFVPWPRIRMTGTGRAFGILQPDGKAWSKSSRSGQRGAASRQEFILKFAPARSSASRPSRAWTGHPVGWATRQSQRQRRLWARPCRQPAQRHLDAVRNPLGELHLQCRRRTLLGDLRPERKRDGDRRPVESQRAGGKRRRASM